MSKIYFHHDKIVTDYLANNPNLPYMISYPRTGSHWIRYVMEKYLKKPSLVMIYQYDNAKEFSCYHTHDLDSSGIGLSGLKKESIIYLYRNPVETVFSILKHQNKDINNIYEIKKYSISYKNHLIKYLIEDDFSDNKLLLRYENFKLDFSSEFKKICDYFDVDFDKSKIEGIIEGLDKTKIKTESTNTYSKIDDSKSYDLNRNEFIKKHSEMIEEIFFSDSPELKRYFK